MITINLDIARKREYQVGDLAITYGRGQDSDRADLVEVLKVHKWGYSARLTGMERDPATGRFKIRNTRYQGTYGGVPRKQMSKFRLEDIDFESLAEWQKFRDIEDVPEQTRNRLARASSS